MFGSFSHAFLSIVLRRTLKGIINHFVPAMEMSWTPKNV